MSMRKGPRRSGLGRPCAISACTREQLVIATKVLGPDGDGHQRPRPLAQAHHGPGQGEPEAAADRLYRPLPGPRLRSDNADGGDASARSTTSSARAWSVMLASPTGPAWQIMKAHGISDRATASPASSSLQAYYTVAGRDLERELAPMLLGEERRPPGLEPARGRAAVGQISVAMRAGAKAAAPISTSRRSTRITPSTLST